MSRHFNGTVPRVSLAGLLLCVTCQPSHAGNWTLRPYIQFQEIYSDNIKLAQKGNETAAFVTEATPSIFVVRQSGRSNLNLNYRMQNLYNASGDNEATTFNQLQFNSYNTLIPNRFFLNANSSVSQQNISNTQVANDNISGSGNRANVNTFSLSPNWTPHFGNYANGSIGANFDTLTTDTIAASDRAGISDTVNLGEQLQLNSGTAFKRVSWNLSFNNRENYRASGNDVSFQNSNATVRTYLNKQFNVFAQGGYSENSFQSLTGSNNGFFYTAGVQWMPSQRYSLEAGYGNNAHVTLNISPMQRLTWVTTFRDNKIGLNSGQTWQTALNYRTQRTTWSLSHNNDTTTVQTLLLQQRVITIDINPDPLITQPVQFPFFFPTQTDQVILTKTWDFSVSFVTGKSNIAVSAFNQDRSFQVTGNHEKVTGINGRWNWQFAPKTSAYINPGWQQIDRGLSQKDNRYDFALGLNRSITNRLNGRLEFRHLNQSSAVTTNNYEENRATASLFLRF
ncbi:TIGR03016 family PEP-CTERM system-associated outer membrane protein [Methylovulum sp.]|uniref:TIGR03016 family PEP-CTERM system-associated outer membrane protein n=1 Tax=Methylovulum sp. TaxID=1916980 RepID=UPI00260CCB2D|nr:TIGR03016 family PEP-CTERM system-associated outer membrane protein [Methylovulum sp.]